MPVNDSTCDDKYMALSTLPVGPQKLATYWELTKPRALIMIVATTSLSYLIAATEAVNPIHLLQTALGVMASAAGALALNQFMERNLDARMRRTRSRPLPSGRLSPPEALVFGTVTMIGGYAFLWYYINPACSIATMLCGVSYLFLYTPLKPRSSLSSFVGAIPGALLPIMGWVAVRNKLEIGAWILFVILFLWQIPHALIISIRHKQDYQAVGMKQLPLVAKHSASQRQMLLNVAVLIPVSIMPAFLNMTEYLYPFLALFLGFVLFWRTIIYVTKNNEIEAKRIFICLSAYLPLLLLAMYFDKPA